MSRNGYFEQKVEELNNLINKVEDEKLVLEMAAEEERRELNKLKRDIEKVVKAEKREINDQKELLQRITEGVEQMAKERQIGFPWLANAYEDLIKLSDLDFARQLKTKKNPALKAAEAIKKESKRRREAEKQLKIANYQIEYYENIAPFLIDLKEEVDVPTPEDQKNLRKYHDEEREDEVTDYLTVEEYRKLSLTEKNQLALDRYWKRHKSKAHIGRMYERFVGYLYEEQGYDVEYVGIIKGFEDLGRDLICKKGKDVVVIQCKCWSKFKTIYEKHIFQFFGTVFEYKYKNPDVNVQAKFYVTTKLSDLARLFSKELEIKLAENHAMDKGYPCIKCNISSKDKTKIYHLPFDQMYDKVKIEPHKGEFYCKTVKEAEEAGFRRAFRYKGKARGSDLVEA